MSKEETINDDLEDGEIETDDDDDEVVIVSSTTTINKQQQQQSIDKILKKNDIHNINTDNYLSGTQKSQKHQQQQQQHKNKDVGYTDDDFADNIENAIAKELLKDNIPLATGLMSGGAGAAITAAATTTTTSSQSGEINSTDGSGGGKHGQLLKSLTDNDDDLRQKLKRLRRKHDGMNSGDREKRRKRIKHEFDDRDDDRGRGSHNDDYLDEYEMICMRGGSPPPQQQQQQSHQYGSSGIYDSDEDSNSSYDSYDSGEYQRRLMQDARQRRRNKDRRDMGGGGGGSSGLGGSLGSSRGSSNISNSMLKKRRGGTGSGDKRKHRGDGDSDVEERQPRKMELCKFYLMDCCAKREKCLYMHSDFPCKFYYLGMKSHNSDTCKFSHGKPLTEHLRAILLKHLETAPKEILGEFPRISRDNAINMLNTTHIRLLVEHGMEQTPSESTQSMLSGGIAPNNTNYIPSLLDIVTKPPPSSFLKNGILNIDNVGGGGSNSGSNANNNGNINSKNDNHQHHHHHKNDRKLDKPRKTRWCNDTKTVQSNNNNSSINPLISSTITSAVAVAAASTGSTVTTSLTTTIPDYLSLKNLTGVITQKQIDDLANMGIENLNQINQLTVAQLNELGLTISQINEIQLNAMNISKLGLSTKCIDKTQTVLTTTTTTTGTTTSRIITSQQQQIQKQSTNISGGVNSSVNNNNNNNNSVTNNSINIKETKNKLFTNDLGGNIDIDLRLTGTSTRINQDIDMRVLPSGNKTTTTTTTTSGGNISPSYSNNNNNNNNYNYIQGGGTGGVGGDTGGLRNDEAPFDYTQYVKDSNINLSDSDDEKMLNLDNCDNNKDVNSPIEDEQELLIDESYYPSDEEKNKSDDEDKENVLKIDEEKPNDDDDKDDEEDNNNKMDLDDDNANSNLNNEGGGGGDTVEQQQQQIKISDNIDDNNELKLLQPPTIPSLASVLLPNLGNKKLGSFSKIDISASVSKMLNVNVTEDNRYEKLIETDNSEMSNSDLFNENNIMDNGKSLNLIKERRDPRLREKTRTNSYGDDDSEDNNNNDGDDDEQQTTGSQQLSIVNSYDPRIMFSSTDNTINQEKRDRDRDRDPRLSSGDNTTELASYDPRSMYGTNTRTLGTLGNRETTKVSRNLRDDYHNILPRDPRLSTITLDARYEHSTNSQSSPVGGTSETTALSSSSSSQETSKSSSYYPEVTQRPSMYDGVLNSDSDSSSSTTNKKSDKDMRMTFFVDSANSSPNRDTDLRLPFKPIPANYILNSDSDSSGSTSNKKSDKDMRMTTFFVDSANSSPNRDTDLRLPFKPILANYIPAKEIDASIKLNAPMIYKVVEIDVPKPDYGAIKRSISVAEDSIDPRVRRIFCLPPDPATTIIGPSSTGEITIMTAAQAFDRSGPRIDPRRRKELSAASATTSSSSSSSANINTPLTLASPPLGSGGSKTAQVNAQVIDMQSILKSSLWYRDLSSTQKITVNQQLAIVNFELRKYHMDPNVDKVFDMTFITTNQLLQQILRSLGVYITDVGAIENINDITSQSSSSQQPMPGTGGGGNNFIDMHQQQHPQLAPMGGNQMDPYGMRMMGNRNNYGHPGGMGFMQQYGSGGDSRPGILGMAPNIPFGHYDPSDNASGRFDEQQIYNEMGMNPSGGYPPGPFGPGSFNDGNYFGRPLGGSGNIGPDNNSGGGGGGNNRNRNNFRSGGGRNSGNNGGNDRWSNNNNSRNNNMGNNRGSGGGSGGGGGGNNSRRNNYDNRDNRSRRDNKQTKN